MQALNPVARNPLSRHIGAGFAVDRGARAKFGGQLNHVVGPLTIMPGGFRNITVIQLIVVIDLTRFNHLAFASGNPIVRNR